MINAYSESYLNDAKQNLSLFFDYAISTCGFDADFFSKLFVQSGYADRFERGNPAVVAGMSGIELAKAVIAHAYPAREFPKEPFAKTAQMHIGPDGRWLNINGRHANVLKIFFQRFLFQRLFPCIVSTMKWISDISLMI